MGRVYLYPLGGKFSVDESAPYIEHSSEGGAAGDLPSVGGREILVAPSTAGEFNFVTFGVFPIACWRVDEIRFEFGSSFVLPQIAAEITLLAKLREQHKKQDSAVYPPLSVFGHADPVGEDEPNKQLSGRRATAIYALLIRDTDLWERLFSNSVGGDTWGVRSIQAMLGALGFPCGAADGSFGPNTSDAVKRFQQSNGLPADGQPSPQTRSKLFLAYMNKLCGDLKLDRAADFLARGAPIPEEKVTVKDAASSIRCCCFLKTRSRSTRLQRVNRNETLPMLQTAEWWRCYSGPAPA